MKYVAKNCESIRKFPGLTNRDLGVQFHYVPHVICGPQLMAIIGHNLCQLMNMVTVCHSAPRHYIILWRRRPSKKKRKSMMYIFLTRDALIAAQMFGQCCLLFCQFLRTYR